MPVAAFHFLHHRFVVRLHDSSNRLELLGLEPGDDACKSGVQGANTVGEAEPVTKEAPYYLFGLTLVNFHGTPPKRVRMLSSPACSLALLAFQAVMVSGWS